MTKYDHKAIEKKWQDKWENENIYRAEDKKKPKYYQLETFPYPSAAGLHVGHPKGYIAEDIHARFMRSMGNEVMYTMGWDAFGLPTENYAIKVGKSPKEVAEANISNFKRQVKMFGLSYDWDREINTSSPEYYKWTQWMFIQLFKAGLAYRKKAKVNWCPKDQTVLANEQVIDGKCERDGELVVQKEMDQWFLKITDYAERLLSDLEGLDWPESTIKRQKDWIGKSEGAVLKFNLTDIPGQEDGIHFVECFTTRPDTLFGATFLVVSPEVARKWTDVGWKTSNEVKDYIEKALNKTELDRTAEGKDKTGVDAGIKAINPATKEKIPVWIADYVLGGYGTGAIMAVPGHDYRDLQFAEKNHLPVKHVIDPGNEYDLHEYSELFAHDANKSEDNNFKYNYEQIRKGEERMVAYTGYGKLMNSGEFDGMDSEKAKWEITKSVAGEKKVQYKIRDWSVSRQRYWGVPIPMVHCEKCGIVPVGEKDLPVLLPDLEDYRPKGMPPLASSEKFMNVKCPNCGSAANRDPETLDTFVDSSWYYLRYTDPHNDKEIFNKAKAKHWMPVDLYVIGAEHTVLHLLYSRFITKFLSDQKYLPYKEPFLKLRHVGLIQGADGQKMSKSRGNVVNPDEVVEQYGVDTVRLYEMFMGPFEDGQPWNTQGVLGADRFLDKVWKFPDQVKDVAGNESIHKLIKKITSDIPAFKFNTAIAAFMSFLNENKELNKTDWETYLKLLAPFAPHLTEELWEKLGHKKSIHLEKWPEYDEGLVKEENATIVVQVSGKVRSTFGMPAGSSQEEVKQKALEDENVKKFLEGKQIIKEIFVQDKLISFVVK